ncbi:MAG: protein-export chaperone SecB [Syntrophales bacterium]|nr:protein-export chaperone SecB [Syntrophales bacterium]
MKQNEHQGIAFVKLILEKVNFEIDPHYTFGKTPLDVQLGVDVEKSFSEDKKRLKIVLHVHIDLSGVDPSPMKIFIVAAGHFSLHDEQNIGALEEFADIQAPTIMFPFVREVIANLTMRTDFPPLLLPPVNMRVILGKKKESIGKVKKVPRKKTPKK